MDGSHCTGNKLQVMSAIRRRRGRRRWGRWGVEVGDGEDGEGCKVNIAPFDGWGRKGSTWVIDVGILRDFA